MPPALDQGDPASPALFASSGFSFTSRHEGCSSGGTVCHMLWTKKAQLHQNFLRVRALSWHSALRFQEAELLQTTLRLLQRRHCSCHLLWTKKAQLHQNFLRVRALSWHSALRFQEAELLQTTLRLLQRRHCSCHLLWAKRPSFTRRPCDIGFCRSALLCDSRRPRFASTPCGCCNPSTGCALCSGP